MTVSGQSMEPTLEEGDRVTINVLDSSYDRFDLVEATQENGVPIVKRVIGLPGDTLWIDGGDSVTVHLIPAGTSTEHLVTSPTWAAVQERAVAECCDSEGSYAGSDDGGPQRVVVPEDSYWLIGDNWDGSQDSRHFGFYPAARMHATALWRIQPWSRFGRIGHDFTLDPVG